MGLKAILSKPIAAWLAGKRKREARQALSLQEQQFRMLMQGVAPTAFGKAHGLHAGTTYEEFKQKVPVRDYEGQKEWFDRVTSGEPNVCWPGKPLYLCKTSGTTSGVKYIPISKESMGHHIAAARDALMCYVAETGKSAFFDGKMIFLQGSPELQEKNGLKVGRLSGITAHHVPQVLLKNRMPSWETNCIDDWETKVNAIAEETIRENMTLISGIPSWVQMYFELLSQKAGGKKIAEIFPQFSLFVFGGVNYEPYRARFEELMGKRVDSIETYPASEGFIAFQDTQSSNGLLLNINAGIFFEFVPVEEVFQENPKRVSLKDVELGVNYAIVLNTNAGLFGYLIGDTVKFVNKDPYRIIVSGRIKHYTSAFGEHVIGEEVEFAINTAQAKAGGQVVEFTLAPQVNPSEGLPYHEWFIEFAAPPADMQTFARELDAAMASKNIYYRDLVTGHVLRPLELRKVQRGGFNEYMKSQGKLGGQNKIPRLSNDRKIAEGLSAFVEA